MTVLTDLTEAPPEVTEAPTPTPTPTPSPASPPTYTIAEVAQQVGVSAHALRYYERIGLVEVPRDAAGRRRYTPESVARVLFITRLRLADLPISRIQHYFALVEAGPHTEPERLALLEEHRDEIRARLASLEDALATIEFKIARYGGSLNAGSCRP